MAGQDRGDLKQIRSTGGTERALVFLHGFSGSRDDTWDRFPGLLGAHVADWDLYTLGYDTTLLPDIVGVWSADPDIPILAGMLRTQFAITPLDRYEDLTIIAHSMGGLVVQRALVDDSELGDRVNQVMLFGTPSGGLRKASWFQFWKRQLRNMARDSEFIATLRRDWKERFGDLPTRFDLKVVAGTKDQFVPPWSSLEPFHPDLRFVVPGDHLSIVKPPGPESASLRLAISTISPQVDSPPEARSPLTLAAETPSPGTRQVIQAKRGSLSEAEIVDSALALEREGNRQAAVALLEQYKTLGTDVQGTLAGRMKRLWLEDESEELARRSFALYECALQTSLEESNHEQVYYHAINLAFLSFVAFDDPDATKRMAELALKHCSLAADRDRYWNVATQAEAQLYLGPRRTALALYREAKNMEAETWQFASTSLQAGQIAMKLEDRNLAEKLEALFTPASAKVKKIFVSYSHQDREWKDRLMSMMAPYVRQSEGELEFWVDDDRIEAGDRWHDQIQKGLEDAKVAVALVSRTFLASEFVVKHELPFIVDSAEQGNLRLLWVYLSPAAYDATPLRHFQAAHDIRTPLAGLPPHEQDQVLLDVARVIKETQLGGAG